MMVVFLPIQQPYLKKIVAGTLLVTFCKIAKRLKIWANPSDNDRIMHKHFFWKMWVQITFCKMIFLLLLIGQMERWQEENDGTVGWWSFVFFVCIIIIFLVIESMMSTVNLKHIFWDAMIFRMFLCLALTVKISCLYLLLRAAHRHPQLVRMMMMMMTMSRMSLWSVVSHPSIQRHHCGNN